MILTLIIALFSLVALMVIHEFGHFIIAKKFGVRVDEFGIGYPPRLFGKKFGETLYSVNLLPLGAFVRIYGEEGGVDDYRSFVGQAIWKRVLIILGGVIAFWIASYIIFTVVFMIGADLPISDAPADGLTNVRVQIISTSQNSPAQNAGIQAGDIILQARSSSSEIIKIETVKSYQDFIKNNLAKEVFLTVKNSSGVKEVSLTPRENPPAGQGSTGIGLQRMATIINKSAWYMAPIDGAIYTWTTTIEALKGLYTTFSMLFAGKGAPAGAEFAGPLGITVFLAQAANMGVGFFLYFIGSISVFIAIFNLFPIPALDGGKLIFLIIEKIWRKPVPVRVEQIITAVFFFILIALSLFITIRFDIPRFWDFMQSSLSR
jgi:regulator of sigma E protease